MASSAADSQTIYSNSTICEYDVHICYNGPGIEDNFISHLKQAFYERQIRTTNDDNWTTRGEDVSQTTLKAIEKARSSVLVFCENFPSKTRCLDELYKVLECEKKGQLVRVIYFKIESSLLLDPVGSFGTAMAGYGERFKNESIKVLRWKVSLQDATELPGRTYKNGCQSQFIQDFVEDFNGILNPPSFYSADCLAGCNSHITEPQNLLDSVIRGRDARNLPKARGSETFFTISRGKEPEVQPSTSSGYTLKDMVDPLGPKGTDPIQYNFLLDLLHSEGYTSRKRKWISNAAGFSVEANSPQKQILISRRPKGSVEAFSASVGVVNPTLLAVEDAGTVATRTSEEVKSFMQTVTSKRFAELIGGGSEFNEHIQKIVSFSADEKISQVMRVLFDDLKRKFTCWRQDYVRADTVLATTAADLAKAGKLQAGFADVVNDCGKAVSAGRELQIQLDHKLSRKRELEAELEAVKSEIAELESSSQEVALRKSLLIGEGTKLKDDKDELMVQVPRIMGEQVAARFTQEFIESEWLELMKLFNEIFKSEFGCS